MLGNRVAPGYLDRRLGRTGIDSQQTDEPADVDRPANLWSPVAGDHGAHGDFDGRARANNLCLWLSLHRPPLLSAWLDRRARR